MKTKHLLLSASLAAAPFVFLACHSDAQTPQFTLSSPDLASGKFEIVVDAERPIEEWVKELPRLIAAAKGS